MSNHKETAFLAQIETHKGMLYKVCRLYQDREEDRQDLLQEIVLQLWVSYDSFRGESKFSSWMYRVALNTAIVYLRKANHRLEVNTPYPDLAEEVRPVRDPEEQLAIFHRAVQQLGKVEKALIFLYMEGHPGKDIATILDLSPGNVRVRLTRAKDKLQDIIKTMGYEF
jgi:RNA polymerase sigma-70 factor (ECF subfamily)